MIYPHRYCTQLDGWAIRGAFNPTAINTFAGVENGFFFNALDFVGLGDLIDKCSLAYQRGHLAGAIISLGIGAVELKAAVKLGAITVGKNGQFYSAGRSGAWSFAQVSEWWKEVWEGEAHIGEHISEQASTNCSCVNP